MSVLEWLAPMWLLLCLGVWGLYRLAAHRDSPQPTGQPPAQPPDGRPRQWQYP